MLLRPETMLCFRDEAVFDAFPILFLVIVFMYIRMRAQGEL